MHRLELIDRNEWDLRLWDEIRRRAGGLPVWFPETVEPVTDRS